MDDEKWVDQIIDKFKFGARSACAAAIWDFLLRYMAEKKELESDTNEAVAARFHISPSVVSRGISGGKLSLDNLVVILVELGLQFPDLRNLPQSARDLAVAGFATAMATVRAKGESHDGGPSSEEIASVACLLATREWWLLVGRLQTGRHDPKTKTEQLRCVQGAVLRKAEEVFGVKAIPRDETGYQRLVAEWGEAWHECRMAIPYNWVTPENWVTPV